MGNFFFFNSEVVCEEDFEFVRFEGGVLIFVVGFEDGLKPFVDELFDVESLGLHGYFEL